MRATIPRDEQPICHFCIRPQEDVDVLFETDEHPDYGQGPNICSDCVHAAQLVLNAKGVKARKAKRRSKMSVISADGDTE